MFKNSRSLVPISFIFIIVFSSNFYISNKYFPFSEGWWECFGYLLQRGLTLYKDFDSSFAPLFIYINKYLINVFDNSFYYLRVWGVLIFSCAIVLNYFLLKRFYAVLPSFFSSLATAYLFMSQPQFIAKDYHTYILLFSTILVIGLDSYIKLSWSADRLRTIFLGLGLGVLLITLVLIKQNLGLILLLTSLLVVASNKSEHLQNTLFVFLGLLLGVALYLPIIKVINFEALFTQNDAKGSLSVILFRFMLDSNNLLIISKSLLLIFIVVTLRKLFLLSKVSVLYEKFHYSILLLGYFLLLTVVSILLIKKSQFFFINWIVICSISYIFVGYLSYFQWFKGVNAEVGVPLWVTFFLSALAYINTTTAVFDPIGMAIPVSFFLAYAIGKAEKLLKYAGLIVVLILILLSYKIYHQKLLNSYSWWGNEQGEISKAKYSTNYKQLDGVEISKENAQIFNEIKEFVDTNSSGKFDTYYYNLPIFYYLNNKLPIAHVVTQWFDVVSTPAIRREYLAVKEIQPKLIVSLESSELSFETHQSLKGLKHTYQKDMQTMFLNWVIQGKYELIKSFIIKKTTSKSRNNKLDLEFIFLEREKVTLSELKKYSEENKLNISFTQIDRNNSSLKLSNDLLIKKGDTIRIYGEEGSLLNFVPVYGKFIGNSNQWETINLYKKNEK